MKATVKELDSKLFELCGSYYWLDDCCLFREKELEVECHEQYGEAVRKIILDAGYEILKEEDLAGEYLFTIK